MLIPEDLKSGLLIVRSDFEFQDVQSKQLILTMEFIFVQAEILVHDQLIFFIAHNDKL